MIGAASRQTRPCHSRCEAVLLEEEFKWAYYGVYLKLRLTLVFGAGFQAVRRFSASPSIAVRILSDGYSKIRAE